MPTLNSSRLPPPQSAYEFERMVNEIAKIKWVGTDFQIYGRPGQKQNGVDSYAHLGLHAGIAIQCKNTSLSLPFDVVKAEAKNAEGFEHKISILYIATTQHADKNLQNQTWALSSLYQSQGKFGISVLFWDDLVNELTKRLDILFQFYPELRQPLHDGKIIEEIKSLLPYTGSIDFIKSYRFITKWLNEEMLSDIYKFWYRCDDPSFSFIDVGLEALKKDLVEKIRAFSGKVGYHYTRSPQTGSLEYHDYSDRSYHKQVIKELEDAADDLISAYTNLLMTARF